MSSKCVWLNFGGLSPDTSKLPEGSELLTRGEDFTDRMLEELLQRHGIRHCYLLAGESKVWLAVKTALEHRKSVRGVVMVEPEAGGLMSELAGRVHALRCPVFIVGQATGKVAEIIDRVPNSWQLSGGRVEDLIYESLRDLPRVPFRFPAKRAAGQ